MCGLNELLDQNVHSDGISHFLVEGKMICFLSDFDLFFPEHFAL